MKLIKQVTTVVKDDKNDTAYDVLCLLYCTQGDSLERTIVDDYFFCFKAKPVGSRHYRTFAHGTFDPDTSCGHDNDLVGENFEVGIGVEFSEQRNLVYIKEVFE